MERFDSRVNLVEMNGQPCAVWLFGYIANSVYTEKERLNVLRQLGFSLSCIGKTTTGIPGEWLYYQILTPLYGSPEIVKKESAVDEKYACLID